MSASPYYEDERAGITLFCGDCRDVLACLPECSVDAIVTDPPYGLGFMAKGWDTFSPEYIGAQKPRGPMPGRNDVRTGAAWAAGAYDRSLAGNRAFQAWSESWATQALRVLKPGGHMLVCGSPRTYHRMASGIEDAGFEIRDCLQWLFGSGFPKSLNLHGEWEGWGTALKPAYEPIVLARKPLAGTVAANVPLHGTGGLNIDGCRIEGEPWRWGTQTDIRGAGYGSRSPSDGSVYAKEVKSNPGGRWPANVLLDEEAARLLDAQSGMTRDGSTRIQHGFRNQYVGGEGKDAHLPPAGYGGAGGVSRFFYTSKTSRAEREYGLDDLSPFTPGELTGRKDGAKGTSNPRAGSGRELSQDDKLPAWVNEVLEAALLQDAGMLLAKVISVFCTTDDSDTNMMLFGKRLTEQFPKDLSSTTETKINSIIGSKIFNSSTHLLISASIRDALSLMESGTSHAQAAELLSRWTKSIGIGLPTDGPLIDAAPALSERLCELSKRGGLPSRVVEASAKRRNDHPT